MTNQNENENEKHEDEQRDATLAPVPGPQCGEMAAGDGRNQCGETQSKETEQNGA